LKSEDQRHRIDAVPDGVDPALVVLCLEASERIRTGRNVAFSHPVDLQSEGFGVRFLPLEGRVPPLRVPFEVHVGREDEVLGYLRLWTGDPLNLVFQRQPGREDEVRVWAIVLLAFADLNGLARAGGRSS
jgi:hypothetical protein